LIAIASATSYVLSGRVELQGVAESGALCIMELARLPGLGLEGGQLRHGPMEMLSPATGIVHAAGPPVLPPHWRPASPPPAGQQGAPVVVFDISGEAAIPDTLTVALPRHEGMAAILAVLPALQALLW